MPTHTPEPRFDQAVLEPAFVHANAVWAGVAILDADGDGRQDLFFTNGESHPNALYINQGDGRFVDEAAARGLAALTEDGGVAAGDLDNDGDTDLVVASECSTGSFDSQGHELEDGWLTIYLNDGSGGFVGHTPGEPLGELGEVADILAWCTSSVTLADMDLDGNLDVVLANAFDPDLVAPWVLEKTARNARNQVFLGDGAGDFKGYLPETDNSDTGERKYRASFVVAALDLVPGGNLELLAGQGGSSVQVHSLTDQGLVRISPQNVGPRTGSGLWMGLAVADFDGDGALEFYGTNQGPSPMVVGYDNTAHVDMPDEEFFRLGHAVLEWDGQDLTVREDWALHGGEARAGDLLVDATTSDPDMINPEGLNRLGWGWGALSLDANADGWPDVMFAGNACLAPMSICGAQVRGAGPGGLLLGDGEAGFVDATWDWGVANLSPDGDYADGRGIATGDLNGDGYADVVVANRSHNPSLSDPLAQELGVPQVWLSRPRENNWLQLVFEGTQSNRQGIGTQVLIEGSEGPRLHMMGAGGQTNSSNERALTLGLGSDAQVDLWVRFPSGAEVELLDVAANQRLLVQEPA